MPTTKSTRPSRPAATVEPAPVIPESDAKPPTVVPITTHSGGSTNWVAGSIALVGTLTCAVRL